MSADAIRRRKGPAIVPRPEVFAFCMVSLVAFLLMTDVLLKRASPNNVRLPEVRNVGQAIRHFKNIPCSNCYSIDISIDRNKRIFLERRETTIAELPRQLAGLRQNGRLEWITLQVDHRAAYGSVIKMARFLQRLGWPERVLLVVQGRQEAEIHHCE